MTLLERISNGMGQRSGEDVIREVFGGIFKDYGSDSGEVVTADRALGLPAVYAAISMIANVGGTLPIVTYKSGGRERDPGYRAYQLLHDRPNPETDAATFWPDLLLNYCGWGNAYIAKSRLGTRVDQLWLLPSDRVTVKRQGGKLVYLEQVPGNPTLAHRAEDIIHIRNISRDGITGLSPIALARESMGSAISMRKHKNRFFRDLAIPPGALTTDQELQPETKDLIRAEWKKRHQDRNDIAILDQGSKFETISVPMADAQFVELEGLGVADVARIFLMPASMLGAATGDSLTYGNRENDAIQFATVTLAGPLTRIESALSNDPELMDGEHYASFVREGLLRADYLTRMQGYRIATGGAGWMLPEEVRDREDLPKTDKLPDATLPAPTETIAA